MTRRRRLPRRLNALFTRTLAGDADAERALYVRLLDVIRELAEQTLRRRGFALPVDEIEDLVQDLVIEAWQVDLWRFDPERGHLEDFLCARVRWRVLDAVRRQARKAEREEAVHLLAADPGTWDTHPEVVRAQAEHEGRLLLLPTAVKKSLRKLPHQSQKAWPLLRRHDLEGQPLCDVARGLGVHPSTVTRARHRALDHLAAHLPEVLREAA